MTCADVARYALGSTGEPTQGAGSVAMIVSEWPRLLELDVGRSGVYARDVHDFWRPLHSKDAAVDGRLSVQCYLDALAGAYGEWRRSGSSASAEEPLARTCYHVPYGKMARKAHRHRRMLDGLDERLLPCISARLQAPWPSSAWTGSSVESTDSPPRRRRSPGAVLPWMASSPAARNVLIAPAMRALQGMLRARNPAPPHASVSLDPAEGMTTMSMNVTVSLPDEIYHRAENLARLTGRDLP